MATYLPRSAWGARPSNGGVALVASEIDGAALHWPGMAAPIDAAGDIGQRRIASALRGWQNYHMDTRGWSDIAYQIAIDQAGRAWTLRGLNIRSGANGDADVNRRFGAFLLILAPGEKPSLAMIATTKGVHADFRKRFPGARLKPYGHRDVRPAGTDCPGSIAYAAIQAGTFTPSPVPPLPPPPPLPEDEMTPAQMTELKAYVQLMAVANNNFTRQALSASTKAILDQIAEVDEETAARVEAQLADDFQKLSDAIIAPKA